MINFTSNDLLLYILNETSGTLHSEIEKAIEQNIDLKNEIEQLRITLNQIEDISIEPSEKLMQHTLKACMEETPTSVIV